jgi:hypothetical protein
MLPYPSNDKSIRQNKHGVLFLLILIVTGLAGNFLNYQILQGINVLFGSFFALLVLQFFGLGRGIAAAAIISGNLFLLRNQPSAIIIMTTEVPAFGWLVGKHKIGMVLY